MPVIGLTGVTAIAGVAYGGYAIVAGETEHAWGNNSNGEFGNGTQTPSLIPVQVSLGSAAIAIAGGRNTGYAVVAS